MKNDITFKLAELFSGPGGLSLGIISAEVLDSKGRKLMQEIYITVIIPA